MVCIPVSTTFNEVFSSIMPPPKKPKHGPTSVEQFLSPEELQRVLFEESTVGFTMKALESLEDATFQNTECSDDREVKGCSTCAIRASITPSTDMHVLSSVQVNEAVIAQNSTLSNIGVVRNDVVDLSTGISASATKEDCLEMIAINSNILDMYEHSIHAVQKVETLGSFFTLPEKNSDSECHGYLALPTEKTAASTHLEMCSLSFLPQSMSQGTSSKITVGCSINARRSVAEHLFSGSYYDSKMAYPSTKVRTVVPSSEVASLRCSAFTVRQRDVGRVENRLPSACCFTSHVLTEPSYLTPLFSKDLLPVLSCPRSARKLVRADHPPGKSLHGLSGSVVVPSYFYSTPCLPRLDSITSGHASSCPTTSSMMSLLMAQAVDRFPPCPFTNLLTPSLQCCVSPSLSQCCRLSFLSTVSASSHDPITSKKGNGILLSLMALPAISSNPDEPCDLSLNRSQRNLNTVDCDNSCIDNRFVLSSALTECANGDVAACLKGYEDVKNASLSILNKYFSPYSHVSTEPSNTRCRYSDSTNVHINSRENLASLTPTLQHSFSEGEIKFVAPLSSAISASLENRDTSHPIVHDSIFILPAHQAAEYSPVRDISAQNTEERKLQLQHKYGDYTGHLFGLGVASVGVPSATSSPTVLCPLKDHPMMLSHSNGGCDHPLQSPPCNTPDGSSHIHPGFLSIDQHHHHHHHPTTPLLPGQDMHVTKQEVIAGTSTPVRHCQVCNDNASGFHYGVWSCEGCKAFFKRSIQGPVDYMCPATNNCTIDKHRRKSCQACRLRRCYEVGMNKGSQRKDRRNSSTGGGGAKGKRCRADSTDTTTDMTPGDGMPCSKGARRKRNTSSILQALQKADLPVLRAFHNHDLPASREHLLNTLVKLADRQLVYLINWAKHVPGYTELGLVDQVHLIECCWLELLLLNCAFQSMEYGGHRLVFAPDFHLDSNLWSVMGMTEILQQVSAVSEQMVQLSMTKEELLLLQATVLVNAEARRLAGGGKIQEMRHDIVEALIDTPGRCRSEDPHRLPTLLLLLAHIRQAGERGISYFQNLKHEGCVSFCDLLSEMLEAHRSPVTTLGTAAGIDLPSSTVTPTLPDSTPQDVDMKMINLMPSELMGSSGMLKCSDSPEPNVNAYV